MIDNGIQSKEQACCTVMVRGRKNRQHIAWQKQKNGERVRARCSLGRIQKRGNIIDHSYGTYFILLHFQYVLKHFFPGELYGVKHSLER